MAPTPPKKLIENAIAMLKCANTSNVAVLHSLLPLLGNRALLVPGNNTFIESAIDIAALCGFDTGRHWPLAITRRHKLSDDLYTSKTPLIFKSVGGDSYEVEPKPKYELLLKEPMCRACQLIGSVWVLARKANNPRTNRAYFVVYGEEDTGEMVPMTLDHIQARSRGGTDSPENLQVLCKLCNQAKGSHNLTTTMAMKVKEAWAKSAHKRKGLIWSILKED